MKYFYLILMIVLSVACEEEPTNTNNNENNNDGDKEEIITNLHFDFNRDEIFRYNYWNDESVFDSYSYDGSFEPIDNLEFEDFFSGETMYSGTGLELKGFYVAEDSNYYYLKDDHLGNQYQIYKHAEDGKQNGRYYYYKDSVYTWRVVVSMQGGNTIRIMPDLIEVTAGIDHYTVRLD